MKKLFTIIFLLCLITTSASGQFFAPQQKPMLGLQINKAHPLGDPVAFYLGNESSGGQVFDLSGNGLTGMFVNSPTWKAGKHGPSIDFVSASDQYIDLGSDKSVLKPQTLSISAVVKCDGVTGIRGIVDCTDPGGDDGYILATNGAAFYFYIDDAGFKIAISATISTGIWYHVVGTFDGTTVRIYVDGILQATTAAATKVDYGSPVTHFIGRYLSATYDFDGLIDNVSIYNRALSPSEIAQLLSTPFCMFQPSWNWMLYGGISVTPSGQVIFINQF